MTGSELTKLVADNGLLFSLPVQCTFASLVGLPIYGAFAAFPEYALPWFFSNSLPLGLHQDMQFLQFYVMLLLKLHVITLCHIPNLESS